MGKKINQITDKLKDFIEAQKMFFVGTAMAEGRVNVSPKGMDSFRVLGPNRVAWLNLTGSGNETATHIQHSPRMTIMFCAFEGDPNILRLYGEAKVVHDYDEAWEELVALFPNSLGGKRQVFDMTVDLVQTSCGFAVPFYDYQGDRDILDKWSAKQGEDGIREYWKNKNQVSLDGHDTNILPQ